MKRRGFLQLLAATPVVARLLPKRLRAASVGDWSTSRWVDITGVVPCNHITAASVVAGCQIRPGDAVAVGPDGRLTKASGVGPILGFALEPARAGDTAAVQISGPMDLS